MIAFQSGLTDVIGDRDEQRVNAPPISTQSGNGRVLERTERRALGCAPHGTVQKLFAGHAIRGGILLVLVI
jgi:hypothetical protein